MDSAPESQATSTEMRMMTGMVVALASVAATSACGKNSTRPEQPALDVQITGAVNRAFRTNIVSYAYAPLGASQYDLMFATTESCARGLVPCEQETLFIYAGTDFLANGARYTCNSSFCQPFAEVRYYDGAGRTFMALEGTVVVDAPSGDQRTGTLDLQMLTGNNGDRIHLSGRFRFLTSTLVR